MHRLIASLAITLILLTACATPRSTELAASYHPHDHSGPVVVVDAALLPTSREEACRQEARHEIGNETDGARAAGMLTGDFTAIRRITAQERVIATFRDSNRACQPHLAAGVQSKPHAVLQKTWDASNLLPKDQHLAGLVSNLMKKPPAGEKIPNPHLTLYNGAPVTCDYDLMDLAEEDGKRIPGESPREKDLRRAFNSAFPVTPQGQRDRVMHGSQAGYGEYAALHTDEQVIAGLFKPEAPLTAFDPAGKSYRFESIEAVLTFYRCRAIPLPASWNIEAEDRSTSPPRRTRLSR